jgi:cell division transport system permease protein
VLKLITKFDYLLRETLLGLRRGGWMNWAAISTVTVLLFLFGISLQASWQMEGLLNQFGSQLEVSVYLETGIQAADLKSVVAAVPNVTEVQAIPKETAWKTLLHDMGASDIRGATRQLEGNPLVDELKVKVRTSEALPGVATHLSKLAGVDEVQYVDEAVQRVAQLNRGLNGVSITAIALLTLTAIAVITTTIRLIVMARRREIEVMQLVGATSGLIYMPFILQGLTFGLTGAGLSWGLLASVQRFLTQALRQQPEFVQFLTESLPTQSSHQILLPLILLGFGGAVGLLGSLFAVRRIAAH